MPSGWLLFLIRQLALVWLCCPKACSPVFRPRFLRDLYQRVIRPFDQLRKEVQDQL